MQDLAQETMLAASYGPSYTKNIKDIKAALALGTKRNEILHEGIVLDLATKGVMELNSLTKAYTSWSGTTTMQPDKNATAVFNTGGFTLKKGRGVTMMPMTPAPP